MTCDLCFSPAAARRRVSNFQVDQHINSNFKSGLNFKAIASQVVLLEAQA